MSSGRQRQKGQIDMIMERYYPHEMTPGLRAEAFEYLQSTENPFEFLQSLKLQLANIGSLTDKQLAAALNCREYERRNLRHDEAIEYDPFVDGPVDYDPDSGIDYVYPPSRPHIRMVDYVSPTVHRLSVTLTPRNVEVLRPDDI